MEKLLQAVALLSIFIMLPDSGASIECYQCNSKFDPRCGDPFDPYSLGIINCSKKTPLEHMPKLEPILCRKNIQKIYGKTTIVRGCGYITDPERDDKACVRRSGTHDVFNTYCSCTTDLCNAGRSLTPTGNLFIMSAALITVMFAMKRLTGSSLNDFNL